MTMLADEGVSRSWTANDLEDFRADAALDGDATLRFSMKLQQQVRICTASMPQPMERMMHSHMVMASRWSCAGKGATLGVDFSFAPESLADTTSLAAQGRLPYIATMEINADKVHSESVMPLWMLVGLYIYEL